MAPELPDLAALRDWLLRRLRIEVVFGDLRRCERGIISWRQQSEVKAFKVQTVQFNFQQIRVPLSDLAGLVVQDAVFSFLCFAQALDTADLCLVPAQLLQCLISRVPCEDHVFLVNDDWGAIAALSDTFGDSIHGLIVSPRVPFVSFDLFDRQRFDPHIFLSARAIKKCLGRQHRMVQSAQALRLRLSMFCFFGLCAGVDHARGLRPRA